jgi:hypothetical protein
MVSDLCSIVNMLRTGQAMGAYIMIGLIGASLATQMLISVLQTYGRRALAWEFFLVLSLAKPGVDAIRVASGEEQIAGAPLEPFTEMIVGKGIEIAFKGGPGAAVQAAIVLGGFWSTSAVVSVGISCLSTGFTAMMVFDYDTKPVKKKGGISPNSMGTRRTTGASWSSQLFTLHTAHAMVKTFAVAMLVRTNWRWLVAYLAADHGMYIMYKIARADLIYFAPGAATAHACAHGDAPPSSVVVYKGAGVPLSLVFGSSRSLSSMQLGSCSNGTRSTQAAPTTASTQG